LLDPQRKANYDTKLKGKLSAGNGARAPAAEEESTEPLAVSAAAGVGAERTKINFRRRPA